MPKASMEMMAIIKNKPVCVSAGIKSLAQGITAKPVNTATKITIGATLKSILSADEGVINSFCNNLRMSAIVWRLPYFPVSIGPRRSCTNPAILRSAYTANKVKAAIKVKIAMGTKICSIVSNKSYL